MKYLILVLSLFLFAGCQSSSQKDETQNSVFSSKKEDINQIELKTQLNYEGTLMPSEGWHNEQTYVLTNGSCGDRGNEIVILYPSENYHNDIKGNLIADNKGLFPFGKDIIIEEYSFCIDQKNGKAILHMEEEFKRQFHKEDAIPAMEALVAAVNKSNFGEPITIRNMNEKSW